MRRTFFALAISFVLAVSFSACHRTESADERAVARQAEAESLYQTAYTLMMERQYKKARDTFKKALKQDKTHALAWLDLSTTQIELGAYKDAVQSAEKAAEYYQNATMYDDKIAFRNDALVQAGEAYLWNNKPAKAEQEFQRAFDFDPASYDTSLNIATTYIRCGYGEHATAFLEKNIRAHDQEPPVLAPLYLLYAQCAYAMGDEEKSFNTLLVARENALKAAITEYDETIDTLYEMLTGESEAVKSHSAGEN